MAIDGISTYQFLGEVESPKKSGDALGMDDFFKLLVAQLSNQDMFNTVDDTQFITQMAQFSMVQALNELSQASATSYSMSLIGKEATVAIPTEDGSLLTHTGIVDSVILYSGTPQLTIDGQQYKLSSVMEVKQPNIIIPDSNVITKPESGEDGGNDEQD